MGGLKIHSVTGRVCGLLVSSEYPHMMRCRACRACVLAVLAVFTACCHGTHVVKSRLSKLCECSDMSSLPSRSMFARSLTCVPDGDERKHLLFAPCSSPVAMFCSETLLLLLIIPTSHAFDVGLGTPQNIHILHPCSCYAKKSLVQPFHAPPFSCTLSPTPIRHATNIQRPISCIPDNQIFTTYRIIIRKRCCARRICSISRIQCTRKIRR